MKKRLYGFLLTIALALLIIILFFGDMLKSPGTVLFDATGNGFTTYYSSAYHARHDALAFRNHAMNYPFGEMVLYTGSQPLITNPVRFISQHLFDISGHTIALLNLAVLFSLILGAVFLWLIFMELGTAWWYASLVSAGIIMLSPQLATLVSDFSLAWVLWIPLTIYLVIRFDRTRKLPYTILIALITYGAALQHPVYAGVVGVILGGYWFFRFFWYRQARTFWYRDAIHIFFQFVLPLLLVQAGALMNDDVTDRSALNCFTGTSEASPAWILLPAGLIRSMFPGWLSGLNELNINALAWIGLVAWIGILAGIAWLVRQIRNRQSVLRVTHLSALNVLFWISLLGLIISIIIRFWLPEGLLAGYFGFLQRTVFVSLLPWLFYYLVNIAVFSALYHRTFSGNGKWYLKGIAIIAILVLNAEGIFHVRAATRTSMVHRPELNAVFNNRDEGFWSETLGSDAFQAILPVPGFHVGSGNIRYHADHPVIRHAMLASLATGLPVTGAVLNRSSLAQTWNQVSLYLEPLERLEFPDFLPDERPLLLLRLMDYRPDAQVQRLIDNSRYLTGTDEFGLYELQVPVLRRLNLMYKDEITRIYEQSVTQEIDGWQVTPGDGFFMQIPFSGAPGNTAFNGGGAVQIETGVLTELWKGNTGLLPGTRLYLSFWVHNYRQDGSLCNRFMVGATDPSAGVNSLILTGRFNEHIKAFSGDWALIEFAVDVPAGNPEISLSVENTGTTNVELTIDEGLVRQEGVDVFRRTGRWLWMNNRRLVVR
jgi:hypothetical protein